MSKRTYQPNNRRRAKKHGFRLRMRTRAGRAILSSRRRKGRANLSAGASVLARAHRMRDGRDFSAAVRRGSRAATRTLVAHVAPGTDGVTSVGFVVSKAVGPAVVRNRVKRRLRHLMRERLDAVPAGSRVVVRANPPAAAADSAQLAEHLDSALARATRAGAAR